MLELLVFAIVLAVAQGAVGFVMMKITMKRMFNKEFIKKYSKMMVEMTNEIQEEMFKDEEELY